MRRVIYFTVFFLLFVGLFCLFISSAKAGFLHKSTTKKDRARLRNKNDLLNITTFCPSGPNLPRAPRAPAKP